MENAFVLLAHNDQEYLNKIKAKILEQESIMAVDIDQMPAVYGFTPCHLSMYSLRLPHLRNGYQHAVFFKCASASTLIADIMSEVSDVVCGKNEPGIVCVIPEHCFKNLKEQTAAKNVMSLRQLLNKEYILFDQGGKDKKTILKNLARLAGDHGWVSDSEAFFQDLNKREEIQSTGIGDGIALPHVRSKAVKNYFLLLMICRNDVEFQSLDDKPVRLITLLGVPQDGPSHLPIMSQLTKILLSEQNRIALIQSQQATEVLEILTKDI